MSSRSWERERDLCSRTWERERYLISRSLEWERDLSSQLSQRKISFLEILIIDYATNVH